MVLAFLQRSGVIGLHVTISDFRSRLECAFNEAEGDNDEADAFFQAIHPHVDRIDRLDVNIVKRSSACRLLASLVQNLPEKRFPRLEDLRINYSDTSHHPTSPCPADVLLRSSLGLPSIRNVTIGSTGYIPSFRFGNNITVITVELLDGFATLSLSRLLLLLEASKFLKDVTLVADLWSFHGDTFEIPTGNGGGAHSITSFTLITKHLSIFNDVTFRSFIRACRFPSLTRLFIKASISDPERCWPSPSHLRIRGSKETMIRERCDCTPFVEDVFAGCESYAGLRVLEVEFVSSGEGMDLSGDFTIPFAQYTPHLEHFGVAAGTLCKLWDPKLPVLRTLRVEGCKSSDVGWLQNYVDQMTASGAIEIFETLRVSCNERVLSELRDMIRLPEEKFRAEILNWEESYHRSKFPFEVLMPSQLTIPSTAGPHLDFHKNVASVEEIDDFTPREIAEHQAKLRRLELADQW